MSVEGRKDLGIMFTDSRSNMSFITNHLAKQLQLEGANTKIFLKVVDEDYTEKEVKVYRVGVEGNTGKVLWMQAVGVGSSTNSVPLQDEAAVRQAFPGIREGALRR